MISAEYIAGFFDGEGSIFCNKPNGGAPTTSVSLAQLAENRDVLDECVVRWGGWVSVDKNVRPCARWAVKADGVQQFLRDIYPYLRIKKRQAFLGLVLSGMRRSRKGSDLFGVMPEGERALRERIARGIKNLNHGRPVLEGLD